MKKRTKFILIVIIILVVLPLGISTLRKALTPAVGILRIEGPIEDSLEYLQIIREFEENDQVRAVIVRLDSPGGKVGPSQEIHEALLRLKEKKPVVASMASVGASGAYYIACAADTVYALSGTMTGSIGVILQFFDVSTGMQKLGIVAESITGGELKSAGSSFRPMTDAERRYFEDMARDVHDQFKEAVASGRGMSRQQVEEYADGRVLTGRQALSAGLIDKLGGLDEVIEDAGKRGGIEGKPRIIWRQPSEGIWGSVRDYVRSLSPVPLGVAGADRSPAYFRFEYSIQ
ncbi:MAG TPA: signal peptide peptidase SppA [Deltaproteobacteria bacterium]|nr:signal peptide peptidase SppA [Bacteriovoracaceae bacterium]HON62517.1 signal peptide peptidase SppA [Deltaproteobacteria bacterium]HRR20097.1 signal peptide peptidase SppA [Desulfomonilia bacterium]HPA83683.1 signal peptide peptidase SppA [Deltaproteobacteria bacterium]HPX49054.1 signal peptide peptidase SppA [Deltaproteobacteria bacterium]